MVNYKIETSPALRPHRSEKITFMKNLFLTALILSCMNSFAQTEKEIKFLALGDSYTIGESVKETERWPVQLVDSLRKRGKKISDPIIIATTGWRTDELKNAIIAAKLKNEFTLVGLLIGVNNQFQGKPLKQYGMEFEDLLKTAIILADGKKENVFVVSIPDYGFTPFGQANKNEISPAIELFNQVNRTITQNHGVQYFNITDISKMGLQEPELVAGDGLHPTGKMYSLWVEKILKGLKL
jgi:lysophospholipase L1-like esterase